MMHVYGNKAPLNRLKATLQRVTIGLVEEVSFEKFLETVQGWEIAEMRWERLTEGRGSTLKAKSLKVLHEARSRWD